MIQASREAIYGWSIPSKQGAGKNNKGDITLNTYLFWWSVAQQATLVVGMALRTDAVKITFMIGDSADA